MTDLMLGSPPPPSQRAQPCAESISSRQGPRPFLRSGQSIPAPLLPASTPPQCMQPVLQAVPAQSQQRHAHICHALHCRTYGQVTLARPWQEQGPPTSAQYARAMTGQSQHAARLESDQPHTDRGSKSHADRRRAKESSETTTEPRNERRREKRDLAAQKRGFPDYLEEKRAKKSAAGR